MTRNLVCDTVVFCAKFQNNLTTKMDIMDERDFRELNAIGMVGAKPLPEPISKYC